MKRPAVNSTAPPPTNHSTQRLYDQQQPQDSFEALPLDHHDSSPSLHDSPYAPRSASFGDIGYRHSPSLSYDDRSEVQTLGDNSSTRRFFGGPSHHKSFGDLDGAATASAPNTDRAFFLDVTEAEQDDLDVIAELARPGYPRLKQILDDEVNRSAGKTMVACTLPFSLPSLYRALPRLSSRLVSFPAVQLPWESEDRQNRVISSRRRY